MPSILFVCTANQFRSPIAAAYFRNSLIEHGKADGWTVQSAGTWAENGQPVPPRIKRIARRLGLDLEQHTSRMISKEMLFENDLIVVMETGHRESLRVEFPMVQNKIFLLSELAGGIPYSISDPSSESEASYLLEAQELCNLTKQAFLPILQQVERL